jgi:hypothetical protein
MPDYQPQDADLTAIAALAPSTDHIIIYGSEWESRLVRSPFVTSVTSSSTPTPNANTDDIYSVTALAAGATFGAPTGTPSHGQLLILRIEDNGTSRSLAFNAIYREVGVLLPTETVAGKLIYIGMRYNSTDTKWDVLGVIQQA